MRTVNSLEAYGFTKRPIVAPRRGLTTQMKYELRQLKKYGLMPIFDERATKEEVIHALSFIDVNYFEWMSHMKKRAI